MISAWNNPASTPHFGGRRARNAATAMLSIALGLGTTACGRVSDEQPESPHPTSSVGAGDPDSAQPSPSQASPSADSWASTSVNLAETLNQSRNTLLTELKSIGSPTAVQELKTDQPPGSTIPGRGTTSWQMGDHQYKVGWNYHRDELTLDASIQGADRQISLTEVITLGKQVKIKELQYTGPEGQKIISDPNAQLNAERLIYTMTVLAKAASGQAYTPEPDWQVAGSSPSISSSPSVTAEPSPSVTPKPSPSSEPSPTEPSQSADQQLTQEPDTLAISSFNVAGPHLGEPGHRADLQAVARSGAAIVGMQEAGEDAQIIPALKSMGPEWKYYRPPGQGSDHTPIAWNSWIVSQIDSGRQFLLPNAHLHDGGKGGNEPKWAVWTRFRFHGQVLRVVNTHLIASKHASAARYQRFRLQIQRLADFLRSIPKNEILLLTGDFNDIWSSPDMKPIRDVMVPNWKALHQELRTHDKRRIPIDAVWLRPSKAQFKDQAVFHRKSDHNQLKVEVSIPEA